MGSRNRSTDNQTSGAQQYVSAPTVHDRMREQLAKDVEAFLAIGGEITVSYTHLTLPTNREV